MRKSIKIVVSIFIFMIVSMIFDRPRRKNEMDIYNVQSISWGEYHVEYITVILNNQGTSNYISCAEEIVRKCQENDFKSVYFSYDYAIPNELNAVVYISEWHVKQKEPLFAFSYTQKSNDTNSRYNIIEHSEQFHIVLSEKIWSRIYGSFFIASYISDLTDGAKRYPIPFKRHLYANTVRLA